MSLRQHSAALLHIADYHVGLVYSLWSVLEYVSLLFNRFDQLQKQVKKSETNHIDVLR